MKVLQINYSAGGSTGKIASAIHEMLICNQEDALFAYGRGKSNLPQTYKFGNELDFRIHTYLSRITGLHGYYSHIPTMCLISKIKEFDPDIVHLHNIHGGYVNINMLLAFLAKENIKTIITLHDCWMYTGGCAHYSIPFCDNWKRQCGHCIRKGEYPKSYIFDTSRKSLKNKKKLLTALPNLNIVTVSRWLENQARQSFLKEKNITTIYNGIDTKIFYPRNSIAITCEKYSIPTDKRIILGVASVWANNKGLTKFLDLNGKLSDDFLIVLVGLTSEQIKSLPIDMIGISRTENQDDLAEIYSMATVLINFSKEETFGMVAAESLACGTPVIVSNTTACPEIVDEETGFSLDLDDTSEVVKRVKWIAENKDEKMKNACVSRVERLFSSGQMLNAYWRLYNRVIGDKENESKSVQPN